METVPIKPQTSMEPMEKGSIQQISTYTVDGRRFVVTPVFSDKGRDTIGTILIRLLKSEVTSL